MKITAILEAINSKIDSNGNRYWALRFTDCRTGKTVGGLVVGGESNIQGVIRHYNLKLDDFDRTIRYEKRELSKREFNALTSGFAYAGCKSEDLAKFIRAELKITVKKD